MRNNNATSNSNAMNNKTATMITMARVMMKKTGRDVDFTGFSAQQNHGADRNVCLLFLFIE